MRMLKSIMFHIVGPCSLSRGQTIKRTGQLQYIRIDSEKCRDKNCMIIFKIENKTPISTFWGIQWLSRLPFEYKHPAQFILC
jgi:hypothetical protein